MLTDEHHKRYELGAQLGNRGGEGSVFEIVGNTSLVGKIYHTAPSSGKVEKLRAMREICDSQLSGIAAWPQQLLMKNGIPCGFLMPKITGKPIHLLYRPIDRKDHFPNATWRELVEVARNIAAAFHALHTRRILMADVNESNILITAKGETRLIDCDSYQLTATRSNKTYLCDVGVPMWTAPELQGRNFSSKERTVQHDLFGLATLIFHLLFLGRHPFAGIPPLSHQENPPTLEDCIRSFQFPYSVRRQGAMRPPPHSLALTALPNELSCLFEEAFLSQSRPTAEQWHRELGSLEYQKCQWGHTFFRKLSDCPWCVIWNRGGPNFFVHFGKSVALSSGTEVQELLDELRKTHLPAGSAWVHRILSLPVVKSSPPDFENLKLPTRTPIPIRESSSGRIAGAIGWAILVLALLMLILTTGMLFLWPPMFAAAIVLILAGTFLPSGKRVRRKRIAKRDALKEEIISHLKDWKALESDHESNFSTERARLASELSETQQDCEKAFVVEKTALSSRAESVLKQFAELPVKERMLANQRRERSQREEHLRRHRIESHRIPQIGEVRRRTLSQYGVHTALDVKTMPFVPGLAQGYYELKSWVARVESKFHLNANSPLSKEALQEIQKEVRNWEIPILKESQEIRKEWHALSRNFDATDLKRKWERQVSYAEEYLKLLNTNAAARRHEKLQTFEQLIQEYAQAVADAILSESL